jgi:hypothetical protein
MLQKYVRFEVVPVDANGINVLIETSDSRCTVTENVIVCLSGSGARRQSEGGAADFTVTLTRKAGYDGPLEFSVELSAGADKNTAQAVTLPKEVVNALVLEGIPPTPAPTTTTTTVAPATTTTAPTAADESSSTMDTADTIAAFLGASGASMTLFWTCMALVLLK